MSAKIAPVGLSPDNVTLLSSVLAIVSIRTDIHWALGKIDNSNAYFIDSDTPEGREFIERYGESVATLVYSKRGDPDDVFTLTKPLRAKALLEALMMIGLQDIHAYRQA